MKKLVIFILAQFALISIVTGQSFDSIKKKAESGNSVAQFDLAENYLKGKEDVPSDTAKAFFWLKKSSEQGNAMAQNKLGLLYEKGEGTSTEIYKAFLLFKKSAEQGCAEGQNNLALLYEIRAHIRGSSEDLGKAFYWFRKGAEQSNSKAQYNLALLYYYGQGTSKNKREAAYWMRKANNNGLLEAKDAWYKLELWKYDDKAKSVNNNVCSSVKYYGGINICLPIVAGMTECYSNPKIKIVINHLYSSETQTFMGVYINSVDYKKYINLKDYRLFDEDIYVFAPNALKNATVNIDYLKELDSQMGNFLKLKWKELKPKIEKHDNYIFKVGRPILLERYNINSYCFSKLFLAQGKLWDHPIIVVKVLNLIEIKHKLFIVLYNLKFNGEESIKEAKVRNEKFVLKFINANK